MQKFVHEVDRNAYHSLTCCSQFEELYGTLYDQPKSYEEEGPHRYIKHWYLFHRNNPTQRKPLPSKNQVITDLVLAGWIQPSPQPHTNVSPVFVELDNLSFYVVDRTREYRGYWIYTNRDENDAEDPPLYWLQEPCPSQQSVHTGARVTLTVLSVLLERVFPDQDPGTTKKHRSMTVENVLTQVPLLEHPPNHKSKNNEDPIDPLTLLKIEKGILAKYKNLIGYHMENFPEFKHGDKFMMSLKGLRVDKSLRESDILWWTEAVEQYLQQYSWGGARTKDTDKGTFGIDSFNVPF
jgi:hypothetical protein